MIPVSFNGTLNEDTVIASFGKVDRPTSIDIDVTGSGSITVRARVNGQIVFATVPIVCSSGQVRHYKFRAPKSTDFGPSAEWILSGNTLTVSAVARFARRDPVVWQKPTDMEKPDAVIPIEGGAVQELPRQWRYANTVAR